jgi:hypothetical protein
MELSQHARPSALTKFSTMSWIQVKRRPLLVLLNVVNHTALLEELTLLGEPEDDSEAVVAPYEKVCRDTQKKAQQSKITSFFTKSSLFPSIMICRSLNHTCTFQPGTHAIQMNTNTNDY